MPQKLLESRTTPVDLSDEAAAALAQMGRRLASKKGWWGDDDEAPPRDRSAISVQRRSDGRWDVRVNNAVGAFSAGGESFVSVPKIPANHLLYLIERSELLPSLDPSRTAMATGESLWMLIAEWFCQAAESLLRHDLIRDYRSSTEELPVPRGRILPLPTSRALLSGRVVALCEFDEFDADNALNRLVLSAAVTVAGNPLLPLECRQRARRITLRLDGIGPLQPADMFAQTDRRTAHYADAVALARSVLSGSDRALDVGDAVAWSFLIRTPSLVETGIREVLKEGLWDQCGVRAGRLAFQGSSKTLNPDLVFGAQKAVGDVKYKLTGDDWNRPDLYQAVSFAAGYRTRSGLVIGFSESGRTLPKTVVGDIEITHLVWDCGDGTEPADAASRLVSQVAEWYAEAAT